MLYTHFCSSFDLYEHFRPRDISSWIEIDFYFRITHDRSTVARNRRFGWFGCGSPVRQFFVSTDAMSGDASGWRTRFSGEFKGRRKPIKRFISCPHPPDQYSFCCFLINGKPVKKFSLDTTTAASTHFPYTHSSPPPLHCFILFLIYGQKCHSASFIAPPLHATLFARSFFSLLCYTLQMATNSTEILLCL